MSKNDENITEFHIGTVVDPNLMPIAHVSTTIYVFKEDKCVPELVKSLMSTIEGKVLILLAKTKTNQLLYCEIGFSAKGFEFHRWSGIIDIQKPHIWKLKPAKKWIAGKVLTAKNIYSYKSFIAKANIIEESEGCILEQALETPLLPNFSFNLGPLPSGYTYVEIISEEGIVFPSRILTNKSVNQFLEFNLFPAGTISVNFLNHELAKIDPFFRLSPPKNATTIQKELVKSWPSSPNNKNLINNELILDQLPQSELEIYWKKANLDFIVWKCSLPKTPFNLRLQLGNLQILNVKGKISRNGLPIKEAFVFLGRVRFSEILEAVMIFQSNNLDINSLAQTNVGPFVITNSHGDFFIGKVATNQPLEITVFDRKFGLARSEVSRNNELLIIDYANQSEPGFIYGRLNGVKSIYGWKITAIPINDSDKVIGVEKSLSVFPDAKGFFIFQGLPLGKYSISAVKVVKKKRGYSLTLHGNGIPAVIFVDGEKPTWIELG